MVSALVLALLCAVSLPAKAPKVVITGDEMEILNGGDMVVFSGKSKVVRGESTLNAERLVQDKKNQRVEASGSIYFRSFTTQKELVEAYAEKALYLLDTEQGELTEGRPKVLYHVKTSSVPVVLYADMISFDQRKEEVHAKGAVEIISSSACVYSPSAVLLEKEKKIILEGKTPQPKIVYLHDNDWSEYSADKITYFVDQKRVLLQNDVRGKMKTKEVRVK
jgi:lipopolysaccharide export system protein LptA